MSKTRKQGNSQFYRMICEMRAVLKSGKFSLDDLPTEPFFERAKRGYENGIRRYGKECLLVLLTMKHDPTFEECRMAQRIINSMMNKKNSRKNVVYRDRPVTTEDCIRHLKSLGYKVILEM